MEKWFDEEEIRTCDRCQGPVVERKDQDGETYFVPVESRTIRIDFENSMLRSKLGRAERIIGLLRAKVKGFEPS